MNSPLTITLSKNAPKRCDLFIIPLSKVSALSIPHSVDKETARTLKLLVKTPSFLEKQGSFTLLYTPTSHYLNHLLINATSTTTVDWRSIGGTIGHAFHDHSPQSVVIDLSLFKCTLSCIQSLVEGIGLGSYRFTTYKTTPKRLPNIKITLITSTSPPSFKNAILAGERFAAATNMARDWANMPANDLNPATFVTMAQRVLKGSSVSVSVIDAIQAKKLGMMALLGVGKGSVTPPRLLVMKYNIKTNTKKGNRPIALVGKGVTFDTGGISIKGSTGMSAMKADMSGAAAVLAAMVTLSQFKPTTSVLGLIPLAENMPDGGAQRPGDIVTAMNGKHIEILNTDAEGRLILADALCYAVTQGACKIVDIATLTGACGVALGDLAMGLLSNNEGEANAMKLAAEKTGERVWQLPLYDDYIDYLESNIADIAHCSEGRGGGTCTAAKFLEQFVDQVPWVHLDIASVMIQKKNKGVQVKGMAGAGARNLVQYILDQS
jgi:leucyl aminopeptidase